MNFQIIKPPDLPFLRAITEPGQCAKFDEYVVEPEKLFALESDGEVVGWMHLHIPGEAKYSAFVYLYIIPVYRRRGIGRVAYREAERRIQQSGCDWWSSYPPSKSSDSFCLNVGFTYTNTNHYMVWHGNERMLDYPADGIRHIEERDIPNGQMIWNREYGRMHRELGIPYDETKLTEEQITRDRIDIREHPERWNNVFLLEVNGITVAYGAVFQEGDGVGAVAVDYAHRNCGYGTRMTAFLTRECIRRGFEHPYLYCEAGNNNAIHVYQKLGYRIDSSETIAVKTRASIKADMERTPQ